MNQKKTKLTVSVGIPAYNEEQNIKYMLDSVLKQKGELFEIEHIYVFCDGCIDNTEKIVKSVAEENQIIEVLSDSLRIGKRGRLNQLYQINESDLILALDADILISGDNFIEEMVKVFNNDDQVCLVSAHEVPVQQRTFIGRIIYYHYVLWDKIRLSVNNGDHIHAFYGGAFGLTKSFAKSIKHPDEITSDRGFLYVIAKKSNGFRYARKAVIFYQPVNTLKDFRLQGSRAIFLDKEHLVNYFGSWIYDLYRIPFRYKFRGVLEMMLKHPIYTPLTLLLGIWLRLFPKKDKLYSSGMWEISVSSKKAIKQ